MTNSPSEDAILIISQIQRETLDLTTAQFNEARRRMIARERDTLRLANRYEANPHLAYEAVTGTDKWFDDFTDEEVENLECLADDMAVAAIANCEGGERIRELVAAGMAFGWYLAARKEARAAAEDSPLPSGHWSGVSQRDFR